MEKKDNLFFDSKSVWLAELKYYSKENNGIEYNGYPLSYAFLIDLGDGQFANPFNLTDNLPVFKRTFYSNYTLDGESFGTKVFLANDIDKTGACYVLSKNVTNMGIDGDVISSLEMIDYMFDSGLYFKDRVQFARDRFKGHPLKLRKFMDKEDINEANMNAYFADRCAHIRRIK